MISYNIKRGGHMDLGRDVYAKNIGIHFRDIDILIINN